MSKNSKILPTEFVNRFGYEILPNISEHDLEMMKNYPVFGEIEDKDARVGEISSDMPFIVYGGFVSDESFNDASLAPKPTSWPVLEEYPLIQTIHQNDGSLGKNY